jgi:uncharacterized protein (DUF736 family)
METKVNSGSIFKNDKKTAENQPDYRGKINVDGKEWEISLWVKEGQKAGKYFSAAIKEPWVKPDEGQATAKPVQTNLMNETDDDGLPF